MSGTNDVRHFLRLADLSLDEARWVFETAVRLKKAPPGSHLHVLKGRAVAVLLEKASTRTRVSFEVGIAQLGGHPVVLGTDGTQLGRGEPVRDTARVLGRMCVAIAYRTFATSRLHDMTAGGVPVINALSDDGHPVQVLCDIFTIEEALSRSIRGQRIAFVGDGSSNMARSWVEAAKLFDFHLALAAPAGYRPPADELGPALASGHLSIHDEPQSATRGALVVNTDVWASMGQEREAELRRRAFAGWTVNEAMLSEVAEDAIVLHCLPAHRGEEIDDATIEGPRSRVWDQAENRLHIQKALLCFLLGLTP